MSSAESSRCFFPESVEEIIALLTEGRSRACLLCGGTDLLVQWHSGVTAPPETVIVINAVPELKVLREEEGHLVIGAALSHRALAVSELVRSRLPALAAAAADVGAVQIQNSGTIGGNVANASPAADLVPPLLAAGASVVAAGPRGRRRIPMESFLRGYRSIDLADDEFILHFEVPVLPAGGRESFHKLGSRAAQAISKVAAACRVVVEDGRVREAAVAMGSVAPTAIRLPEVEKILSGRPLDGSTIQEAAQAARAAVRPIDDIRSTAEYRRWAAGSLVELMLEELSGAGR